MINFRELPFHTDDLKELEKLNIKFVFQPIYDARNLKLVAYEALMRPEGKSPLELIAEYEKEGKLHTLEVATCFGSAIEYRKRGYTKNICINSFPCEALSEEEMKLYFDHFPDMEGKIIVEIVEYTELNKSRWGIKKEEIKGYDMKISLDDYSTGNNDITAVDFFNPHYVKLDRSLISEIDKDESKQQKVIELINKFHERAIEIVAEGVETKEEYDFLRNCTDVDYLQGYYLAMPQ